MALRVYHILLAGAVMWGVFCAVGYGALTLVGLL